MSEPPNPNNEQEAEQWLKDGQKWLERGKKHILTAVMHPWESFIACLHAILSIRAILFLVLLTVAFKFGGWVTTRENAQLKEERQVIQRKLDSMQGALNEARQERDSAKSQLAPFQAMAIKLYTNAPVEERISLFSAQMFTISSNFFAEMDADRPTFDLFINNQLVTNGSAVSLFGSREVSMYIKNTSPVTAEQLTVILIAPMAITKTDIINLDGWEQMPPVTESLEKTNILGYCWRWMGTFNLGPDILKHVNPFEISTNITAPRIQFRIEVYAARSKRQQYYINFLLK